MRLVTREQTAKDADSPAQKEETNREQQERLAGNSRADCNNLGKDSRDNSAQLSKRDCIAVGVSVVNTS